MGDHIALDVDRLASSTAVDSTKEVGSSSSKYPPAAAQNEHLVAITVVEGGKGDTAASVVEEVAPLLSSPGSGTTVECRICQEEDDVANLETPCACSGSVKFAHRKCVQRWCNEKGDTTCEICHQPYKNGYTAPPRPLHPDGIPIELSGEWGITGAHQLDLHDPRILAMAAAERHFLEAEYDEYAAGNATSASCCRSAALILMALLLLRHALAMADANGNNEDTSTFFTLFLLRAAGFLLPCYIMARAMNILQRRRQRQEAAMAAAILLQAGQARGMRFSVAPGPSAAHELV